MDNSTTMCPKEDSTKTKVDQSALGVEKHQEFGHLHFYAIKGWKGEIPPDQQNLQQEFDHVCSVLRSLFLPSAQQKFCSRFEQLLDLAKATFSPEGVQIETGKKQLEIFKNEILKEEAPSLKNSHLKELALWAFLFSVVIIFFTLLINYFYSDEQHVFNVKGTKSTIVNFGFLLVATMWGIWLSFSVRNIDFKFEQLQYADTDFMRPWSRFLTYGLLAFMFALFFDTEFLVITVGGISTNNISDDTAIAICVGLCLGFADKALPDKVRRGIEGI